MIYGIVIAVVLFFISFFQYMVGKGFDYIYLALLISIVVLQIITLEKLKK